MNLDVMVCMIWYKEMGHYIVRGAHRDNPEKHSRIWQVDDFRNLCAIWGVHDSIQNPETVQTDRNPETVQTGHRLLNWLKVLTWYLLENFCGPEAGGARGDSSYMYIDLPPNMESNTIEAVPPVFDDSEDDISKEYLSRSIPQIIGNLKKLRWMVHEEYPASSLPTNFQPMGLCYLKLGGEKLKRLWEGKQHLPSLKRLDLRYATSLMETPDISGLPRLEYLILEGCFSLKEIHPSIGCHERLVLLNIHGCSKLQSFPPIVRMKKVETLNFSFCYGLRKFPEIQTNMDSLKHLNLSYSGIEVVPSSIRQYCTNLESLHLGSRLHPKRLTTNFHLLKYLKMLRLSHHTLADENILFDISQFSNLEHLKELRLSWCSLEDENIASDISQLSNLDILDLSGNKFTRIGCSLSQLVHLKFLKISHCENLVELPDLPSCIAVLDASGCTSLEILGGFPTNCKWLWKVSLQRKTEVGHIDVERVVESMLEGNAVETYYMNLHVDHVDMLARSHQHLQLPLNWYNDFAGFLIRVAVQKYCRVCSIVMKQGMHMDYQSDLLQSLGKTDKWGDSIYCYISFGWLKQTSWWNSSYTTILFAIGGAVGMAAEVVPRRKKKSKGDTIERANGIPADCCQFWEEGFENQKAFTVAHDSKSSLEIQWRL